MSQTSVFKNGADSFADFDQSFDPINPSQQGGQAAGRAYVARGGESLSQIALQLWGDASLWWMIADANGLSGDITLPAGMQLSVSQQIAGLHNSGATFRPYNPNEAMGDVSAIARGKPQPEVKLQTVVRPAPPPPAKKHGCGGLGAILVAVVAVVVTAVVAPWAAAQIGGALFNSTVAASVVGGAIGGAAGSIASQAVGIAVGVQDKFSWNAVGMAALGGGISGGLEAGNVFGKSVNGIAAAGEKAGRAIVGSALSQGIGVATGMQDRFSWADVAVAGVGAFAGSMISDALPGGAFKDATGQRHDPSLANVAVSGMAGGIAAVGARSLVTGTDFGDNIIAALPSVIGSTVGEMVAGGVAAHSGADGPSFGEELEHGASAVLHGAEHLLEGAWHGLEHLFGFGSAGGVGYLSASPGSGNAPASAVSAGRAADVEAAIPKAIQSIEGALSSKRLSATEKANLQISLDELKTKNVQYDYDQSAAIKGENGEAYYAGGKARIKIILSNPKLFNRDGTVNITTLSSLLVHESRHLVDIITIDRTDPLSNPLYASRRTERNAYRAEATYIKAMGIRQSIFDDTGAAVDFSPETSDFRAEDSVQAAIRGHNIAYPKSPITYQPPKSYNAGGYQ